MINEEGATAFESFTVGTGVSKFNPTKSKGASRAIITCETAQIFYRYDAGDTGADDGHIMDVGEKMVLEGSTNIKNFRATATGATSGVLKVTYERI